MDGHFGERSLDGASAYAEKNWGAAFADHWWWGQATLAEDAGVAFAGGRVHGVAPTAVAVWTPGGLVTLAPPFARTLTRAGGGEWHVRARSPRWDVELHGEATDPLLLPVPIPGEKRLEVRSRHHLLGTRARAGAARPANVVRGRVGRRRARGRRYPAWFMTSSAMSSSPPSRRSSSRRT